MVSNLGVKIIIFLISDDIFFHFRTDNLACYPYLFYITEGVPVYCL